MRDRLTSPARGAVVAFVLAASLSGAAASDPFPEPAGLAEQISFWQNVFGVWSRAQVAVHDVEHLGLVYEVFDLPGVVGENTTAEQQAYVDARRGMWEQRLAELARRLEGGEALSDEDKALALRITTTAGTAALRDASARVRTQRGIRERFRRGLEISHRYEALFRSIFREAGLPEDLAYLPHVESSFQARAQSSAGAVGVWQFTRSTGRQFLTIGGSVDERLDPVAAARGAARYFRKAHGILRDWPLAVTSYNYGIAGMARARERLGADIERVVREYDGRTFGFASRNFYAEFLAARAIAREPLRWFPEGFVPEPPLAVDQVVLPRSMTVAQLAREYEVPTGTLRALNPAWVASASSAGLPEGLAVWLPAGTLAGGLPPADAPVVADLGAGTDLAPEGAPATPAAVPAAEPAPAVTSHRVPRYHTVRRGETLWSVAQRYDLELARLRTLNGMSSRSKTIRVGQRLKVGTRTVLEPRTSARRSGRAAVHVVRRGDTLHAIATAYRVNLSALLGANRLDLGSVIRPGQRLSIPSR